jgi:hypothetical protein
LEVGDLFLCAEQSVLLFDSTASCLFALSCHLGATGYEGIHTRLGALELVRIYVEGSLGEGLIEPFVLPLQVFDPAGISRRLKSVTDRVYPYLRLRHHSFDVGEVLVPSLIELERLIR